LVERSAATGLGGVMHLENSHGAAQRQRRREADPRCAGVEMDHVGSLAPHCGGHCRERKCQARPAGTEPVATTGDPIWRDHLVHSVLGHDRPNADDARQHPIGRQHCGEFSNHTLDPTRRRKAPDEMRHSNRP
jgi:hypothetical protein